MGIPIASKIVGKMSTLLTSSCLQYPGIFHDEGHLDPGIVERHLGPGELRTVVGGEEYQSAFLEAAFLYSLQDPSRGFVRPLDGPVEGSYVLAYDL